MDREPLQLRERGSERERERERGRERERERGREREGEREREGGREGEREGGRERGREGEREREGGREGERERERGRKGGREREGERERERERERGSYDRLWLTNYFMSREVLGEISLMIQYVITIVRFSLKPANHKYYNIPHLSISSAVYTVSSMTDSGKASMSSLEQ